MREGIAMEKKKAFITYLFSVLNWPSIRPPLTVLLIKMRMVDDGVDEWRRMM